MQHVIISSLAASTIKDFTSARDAVEHGVGLVERNTVPSTTILLLVNAFQPQKIITINVAGRNQNLRKLITVLGGIVHIVLKDGKGAKGPKGQRTEGLNPFYT